MTKRSIKIREVVRDVRAGLTYLDLLDKYRLNPKQFQKMFKKLLNKGAIDPRELMSSLPEMETKNHPGTDGFEEDMRRVARDTVDFPLPIYDKDDAESNGTIRDISERGIQIEGIPVHEGDVKTFIIPEHDPFVIDPIELDAICRWVKKQDDDQECLGGFEVLRFSQGNLADILVLMRFVYDQLKTQDIGKF